MPIKIAATVNGNAFNAEGDFEIENAAFDVIFQHWLDSVKGAGSVPDGAALKDDAARLNVAADALEKATESLKTVG